MERHEPHYLRKIIEKENLTKYASKAGVTSFQNSVVKTYMKGVNESQLAKKYEVTPNAIHEYSGSRVPSVRCWETAIPLIRKPSFR